MITFRFPMSKTPEVSAELCRRTSENSLPAGETSPSDKLPPLVHRRGRTSLDRLVVRVTLHVAVSGFGRRSDGWGSTNFRGTRQCADSTLFPTVFDILDFIVNVSLLNGQRREQDAGIPTCAGNDPARPHVVSTESETTTLRQFYD